MSDTTSRILIVDDDLDILANISDILADAGFETETASDGSAALEKITPNGNPKNHHFDLCLIDFKMPGMDGVELAEQIRVKKPNLRTIMITAYAGDDGAQRALAAGMWKVLQKPIDIKLLLTAIDQAIPAYSCPQ
jgi:CheY-like chemotaxis protein